jgi:hypothetical protein
MTRAAIGLAALLCAACSTAAASPEPVLPETGPFSHDDLDQFLRRFVDGDGRVAYPAARTDRKDLDRYLSALARTSPDSHPGRFPGEADRLAYWINAYNASVISLVLHEYPIASVKDVRALGPLSFLLPRLASFFVLRRVTLGGTSTTLYSLENRVIRSRFDDPRVHFALNCASGGCPHLPARAFTGPRLEEQLARETASFLADPRNLRLDPEQGRIHLSSIFSWYESDFTKWVENHRPDQEPSLLTYVRLHAEPARQSAIAARDWRVEFIPYDWTLNDQQAQESGPE